MKGGTNPFAAVDPCLGYLYQVRLALLFSLSRMKMDSDFFVSIETLDDVAFESPNGHICELLQTKHHRNLIANLTDSSPDLWKTLRIWFERYETQTIAENTNLFLITTSKAMPGSIASKFKHDSKNVNAAQLTLSDIARTSTNETNKEAYNVFLNTSPERCKAILEKITVIDSSLLITDIADELQKEVFWAVAKEFLASFVMRLEGWWFHRIIQQLTGGVNARISSTEIDAYMSDLREQFKLENLPIDDDLLDFTLDKEIESAHVKLPFVIQLQIIKVGKKRIASAIRDYYRAFQQRSRWLRENLTIGLEISKYEKRLKEEWEIVFEAIKDELDEKDAEEIKIKAARSVLQWAERVSIPIRKHVTEPFITRGSLHILAEMQAIGWHPEFRERLNTILSQDPVE